MQISAGGSVANLHAANVRHDADYLEPVGIAAGPDAEAYALADGVFAGEVATRQRLVDEEYGRRRGRVALVGQAPADDGHADGAEVLSGLTLR